MDEQVRIKVGGLGAPSGGGDPQAHVRHIGRAWCALQGGVESRGDIEGNAVMGARTTGHAFRHLSLPGVNHPFEILALVSCARFQRQILVGGQEGRAFAGVSHGLANERLD